MNIQLSTFKIKKIVHRLLVTTDRNEVVAKVMFLHVSVILLTGGVSPENPPSDQADNPPWTRETPQPGRTPLPPRTKENPPNQADPPAGRTPPQPGRTPRDQGEPPGPGRHPPGPGRPPWTRRTPPPRR